MGLNLNLSMNPLPEPLSQFLHDVSKIKDSISKLSEIDGYVGKLEEERKKIEVFKRELPLCMLLLTEVIETLKEEASSSVNGKLDVGEGVKLETDNKKNWMSSAKLWISNSNSRLQSTKEEEEDRCMSQTPFQTCNNKPKQGGALMSFDLAPPPPPPSAAPLPLMTPSLTSEILTDYNSRTEQSHHIQKKEQRRRWSEGLHRMFVDALQMIGGSRVATPKQIRDIMKVDGLTNDEVKSHLQKYRMHTRKNPLHSEKSFLASRKPRETQRLISLSRSDSPQGPLLVDRGLFSNDAGHSSEEEEKSDGRSWKSESRRKRQQGLDLEL